MFVLLTAHRVMFSVCCSPSCRWSLLLLLCYHSPPSVALFHPLCILSGHQSFRKGSDVPQAPGTGGDIMYGEDGMPFHYINSEDLFPNTQHPQVRILFLIALPRQSELDSVLGSVYR